LGLFEKESERAVVLALVVPLIISSGGNSGSQASTLVIRALAVGARRLGGPAARGAPGGGGGGSARGYPRFDQVPADRPLVHVFEHLPAALGARRGDRRLTLIAVVLWGTLVGSMLPLVLRRLGFDPATSSAPFAPRSSA
jgi:magnesium transporter